MSHRSTNLAIVPVPAEEEDSASDRREHRRLSADELSWLNEVRLKYGPKVKVIDLSASGAQIETVSHRLQPGASVVIEMTTPSGEVIMPSRVVRCQVVGVVPHLTYRGAVEFKRPLELPQFAATAAATGGTAMDEHANLAHAIARMQALDASRPFTSSPAALEALLELVESPEGRRAGSALARELSPMLKTLTRCVEGAEPFSRTAADVIDRLRRLVPVRNIRLFESTAPVPLATDNVLHFDIKADESSVVARMVVDLPRGEQLNAADADLIDAVVSALSLMREIGRPHLVR